MNDAQDTSPPVSTFIVRFWQEPDVSRAGWSGQVTHVQSGERAGFTDDAGLWQFIRRWVEAQDIAATTRREL